MHGPHHHLQAPGVAGEPAQSTEPGILSVLWKRKFLIIVCGMIGLGVGYFRFVQQPAVYQSRARVMLTTTGNELPLSGVQNAPSAGDSALTELLKSETIAEATYERLEKDGFGNLASLQGPEDRKSARILSSLQVKAVSQDRGGSVFNLTYEGREAADCKTILTRVILTYTDYLDQNYRRLNEDTVAAINKARGELDTRIRGITDKHRAFRDTSPLLTVDGNAVNVFEARLLGIEEQRKTILLEKTKLKGQNGRAEPGP